MNTPVFVTGMLRSGTSLTQVLLTNHPQAVVVYQPFHQFYVDVKQTFLDVSGLDIRPPLDDGRPCNRAIRPIFLDWLSRYRFEQAEANRLAARATSGKGGSIAGQTMTAPAGMFLDLWRSLHMSLVARYGQPTTQIIGSKEILCEEFIPVLADAGIRCVLVVRDPRAVIASANFGSYRESVGDRYPLLMLLRLWRKSAEYWLQFQHNPGVCCIRYEDLVSETEHTLSGLSETLQIDSFSEDISTQALRDHAGRLWRGNSSFGNKATVDRGSSSRWRNTLSEREIRFIEACTKQERRALGYADSIDASTADILTFCEDESCVRPAYLERHALTDAAKTLEINRFLAATSGAGP